MRRKSSAVWHGTGLEGSGTLSSTSGVLDHTPYSFAARFKSEDGTAGTNPEELIAAAHAGCFSMALSFQLTNAGFPPNEIKTDAILTLENKDGGFSIVGINLDVTAEVPDIDDAKFQELAKAAKENCPVSKALNAVEISMTATLEQ
jgi:osmotically inducible protein OsmC